ncbi:MAG: hypothetical protein RLO52_19980 [Sandaracinaceae bacterium]
MTRLAPPLLLLLVACSEPPAPEDARAPRVDASAVLDAAALDGGADMDMDAGVEGDAGVVDGGAPEPAAGPPRCADAVDCEAAAPSVVEHNMVSVDGCSFALVRDPAADRDAQIDALAARMGGARTVADVLGHLNREGRAGISSDNAGRMRNHAHVGFRWNAGDEAVDYWYPQGITGSSDAQESGRVEGRRLLMVSWYHRTDARPTKGARVSLVDYSDPSAIRYRHLLLVTPTDDGASYGAAEYDSGGALHAGGIVWVGDHLYVADTSVGLRVYDLSRILQPSNSDDGDRVGLSGGRSDAHGYRYAVPQLARYRLAPGSCPIRFSFAGLDRAASVIVTGEYRSGDPAGRVARWAVDLETGWLREEGGRVPTLDAAAAAQTRMQGGLTFEGVHYLSSSSQAGRWGRLYRTRPGRESVITAWPYGCEDLYVERAERLIWTSTEHPPLRDTLGIPLQGLPD